MTERAEVIEVHGETATVRRSATETCSSCTSILCSPRARTYVAHIAPAVAHDAAGARAATAPNLSPGAGTSGAAPYLSPGAFVEVEVPTSGALGKGLLLFGLPLALFAAVYFALGSEASEAARAGGGFGGLAVGLLVAVGVSRLWKDPTPEIVAVYRSPELVPFDVPASS